MKHGIIYYQVYNPMLASPIDDYFSTAINDPRTKWILFVGPQVFRIDNTTDKP